MPILATRKFAITSDFFGVKEDIPSVKMSNIFMPGSNNTFLQYGMVRAMPGRQNSFLDDNDEKTITPDANPIIRYHRHVSAVGIEYEFAFTKDNVYRWNATTKDYTLYFAGSECTLWDTVSFHKKVIITNAVDKIQVWDEDTPGTIFAPLGGENGLDTDGGNTFVTAAKYLHVHENYLHLGYTTEGGASFPFRRRWCGFGNETEWQSTGGSTDAGYYEHLAGAGVLKGFGSYTYQQANILVVFKTESLHPVWLVQSREVWNSGEAENTGLLATHSVVNDKEGNLYYIANDYTIRQYLKGEISQSIDPTVKGINQELEANIEATFIDVYKQIWWSIPSNAASTGNDKILVYNLKYPGVWHFCDFDIRAFGRYSSQISYTIDGLDAISDTIDGLDAVLPYIDYVSQLSGFPLDLGSDYEGYTYNLHNSDNDKGVAFTRDFVISTDLSNKRSLYEYKRIMNFRPLAKAQPIENELTFSFKEDGEANYENVGVLSLNATSENVEDDFGDIDQRAKHFLIKGTATNRFDFIGSFFEFDFDGDA